MLELTNLLIVSVIQVISWTYVNKKLSTNKLSKNTFVNICNFLIMVLCIYTLFKVDVGFLKPIVLYFIMIICYKYMFEMTFSESLVINFLNVILHGICEASMALLLTSLVPKNIMTKYILTSSLTGGLAFFLIIILLYFFSDKLKNFKNILNKGKSIYFLCILLVFGICILIFFKINSTMKSWNNQSELVVNTIISLLFITVIILFLQERLKTFKVNHDFNNLFNNFREILEILEVYKKKNHENETDLRIIKTKANGNHDIVEYIDYLLTDKKINTSKRWITELNKIKNADINTFLLLKISNAINDNINFNLHINKKVSSYDFSKLKINEYRDFCRLLSIYIDNAYDACIKTDKKELCIDISIVSEKLEIIICNTFKEPVDLKKIDKPHFSTKGLYHGVGRTLAREIVTSNDIFNERSEIIENYFFQYLFVKK